MRADGTVKSEQKISDTAGGFTGLLDDGDHFGNAIASLGDLDGDGVSDLAVGATGDDDGGTNRGAVWILFMKADGTVLSEQKISDTVGGFTGVLDSESLFGDLFGSDVFSLGDLDGDGVIDLAVGEFRDDDGGTNRGAVWILFLNGVPTCALPDSGDWMVTQDCTLSGSATAPGNVIVEKNVALTIAENASLDIDFANRHLKIKNGAKVVIKSGGKIFQLLLHPSASGGWRKAGVLGLLTCSWHPQQAIAKATQASIFLEAFSFARRTPRLVSTITAFSTCSRKSGAR